jgi:hypothetical protein
LRFLGPTDNMAFPIHADGDIGSWAHRRFSSSPLATPPGRPARAGGGRSGCDDPAGTGATFGLEGVELTWPARRWVTVVRARRRAVVSRSPSALPTARTPRRRLCDRRNDEVERIGI